MRIYKQNGLLIYENNGTHQTLWGLTKRYIECTRYANHMIAKAVAGDVLYIEAIVFLSAANLSLGNRTHESWNDAKRLGGDFREIKKLRSVPEGLEKEVKHEAYAATVDMKMLDKRKRTWEDELC